MFEVDSTNRQECAIVPNILDFRSENAIQSYTVY